MKQAKDLRLGDIIYTRNDKFQPIYHKVETLRLDSEGKMYVNGILLNSDLSMIEFARPWFFDKNEFILYMEKSVYKHICAVRNELTIAEALLKSYNDGHVKDKL